MRGVGYDQAVDLLETIQGWRYRRHQGQRCRPKGVSGIGVLGDALAGMAMPRKAEMLTLNSMPHKVYHGKTGVVYNVTKSAVGVIIYKKVKHRYIEKRVNLRVEHVSLSRSREEFVRRVKANAELKKKSQTEGTHVNLKRQPAMPREARTISMKENIPETVVPVYVHPCPLSPSLLFLLTFSRAYETFI